jgi:hypothetical protein
MKLYQVKTVLGKATAIFSSYNILAENMEEALEKWKKAPVEEGVEIDEQPEEIEMIAEIADGF